MPSPEQPLNIKITVETDRIADQIHSLAEKARLNIRFAEVLRGFFEEDA